MSLSNTDSVTTDRERYRKFRAPRESGTALIDPALASMPDVLAGNIAKQSDLCPELSSIREEARRTLLADARRYTSAYRDVTLGESDSKIVMAGHQPTLFHPGVWFKNFALDSIARSTGALAVNLVVDSDVAPPSSIRVPTRRGDDVAYQTVPYDTAGGGVPFEQSLVRDRDTFDHFDQNVASAVSDLVGNPLVGDLWKHARTAIERCGYAGCALAQARHGLESEIGLQSLEIPQSVICRSEPFAKFAMQILLNLPRFRQCYNDSADRYRIAHGLRSRSHPVPNLGRDGDWYETPFWVYGNESPERRAVWVRRTGGALELSDRQNRLRKIDSAESETAWEALTSLNSPEFRLRSRALITTMYARLVLSDLFIHGIGGGKYDQLGDEISRGFWQIETPAFVVVSGTIHLPEAVTEGFSSSLCKLQLTRLDRQLRDLQYQPERFADDAELPQDLLRRKASLLTDMPPRGHRAAWQAEITAINRTLAEQLDPVRESVLRQHAEVQQELRRATILENREHPFCIFDRDQLTETYRAMLG